MNDIDLITNDYFKTLSIMYDNQITVDDIVYCPLPQIELANKVGVSRNTMGTIIKKLKNENLICCNEGQTKKYILSERAIEIVKKMKRI